MLGARELQGARVLQSTRELQGVPVLQSTHELQVKRVCRTRGRDAYYPPSGKKEETQSIRKHQEKVARFKTTRQFRNTNRRNI